MGRARLVADDDDKDSEFDDRDDNEVIDDEGHDDNRSQYNQQH